MQNRNNKRRQEKRAEKKLEKQKIQQELAEKNKKVEEKKAEKEAEVVVSQENIVEKQDTPEETPVKEETCCQSCQNSEEATEEPKELEKPKEEKEVACCCQEEPKEKCKTHEAKAKDNSSYGEFFIGLTIGAVLLALGALIVFLFQVDYMRGLEKKVNELQNSSAKSEIKTDIKAIQDKMVSLEKKIFSVDSLARFQEMENKIVVLQKQLEGNKEDAKKLATLETLNQKLEQVEKPMAAQKQDFDHFKTLQDMNSLSVKNTLEEYKKQIESFKANSSLENTTKALGESLEKAQTNFQEKTNEIQKQLDVLKQNDLTKALEMKLELLQTTLQTLQQQHNEHLEGFKKLKVSLEGLSSQVEKLSTPSSEPK